MFGIKYDRDWGIFDTMGRCVSLSSTPILSKLKQNIEKRGKHKFLVIQKIEDDQEKQELEIYK
jgi:hypothetical protein